VAIRLHAGAGSHLEVLSGDSIPQFKDDGDRGSLIRSVEGSLNYYRSLPEDMAFDFGGKACRIGLLIQSLDKFKTFLSKRPSTRRLNRFIRDNFVIYRDTAPIIFSAYYEHSFEASFKPDIKYRFPIYASWGAASHTTPAGRSILARR
jgi:membrane-bound lytic murein transglycosylase A